MTSAPIKVLVIDDEPPIRKLLRMGLTTQGYEILEASNGKIALDLLAQDPSNQQRPGQMVAGRVDPDGSQLAPSGEFHQGET